MICSINQTYDLNRVLSKVTVFTLTTIFERLKKTAEKDAINWGLWRRSDYVQKPFSSTQHGPPEHLGPVHMNPGQWTTPG